METRQKIMDVAKKLFVSKGFEGATVREICEAAGVSISAINYHFENKDGLYKAILTSVSQEHYNVGFEALEAPESEEGFRLRLRFFIDSYISHYMEDPEVQTLIMRDLSSGEPKMGQYAVDRAYSSYKKLLTYIEEAKYKGVVDPDVNSGLVASMIFNTILSQLQYNDFSSANFGIDMRDPSFRKAWINGTIDVICNGVKVKQNRPALVSESAKASGE